MARDLTLRVTGTLSRLPLGTALIEFLGHMEPPPIVSRTWLQRQLISPVGLGAGLNLDEHSLDAISHFGFGFVELGPITVKPIGADGDIIRNASSETISYPDKPINLGIEFARKVLQNTRCVVPLGVRISHTPGSSIVEALEEYRVLAIELSGRAHYIVIDSRWWSNDWDAESVRSIVQSVMKARQKEAVPVLISICGDCDPQTLSSYVKVATEADTTGVIVSGGMREKATLTFGRPTLKKCLDTVRRVREMLPEATIIGSGGIVEPADALAYLAAGASLVQLHSGLVYSGPGLANRINQALASSASGTASGASAAGSAKAGKTPALPGSAAGSAEAGETPALPGSAAEPAQTASFTGWMGFAGVGLGLIVVAMVCFAVALSTIILPYDEAFLGLNHVGLRGCNPHLLPFMSHDRITFAGVTLSTGILYFMAAFCALRRREKWAYRAILWSATLGFASFLLCLGFHYFDLLHGVVCVILLPFFLWGACAKPRTWASVGSTNLYNTASWKRALWGQLLFVSIGLGLMLAGLTISFVGTSTVFVHEDLDFMQTTAEHIRSCSAHLMPVIAHDRAGFGGGLACNGLLVMTLALHGFNRGSRWLWWTYLTSGLSGFVPVLLIHWAIGYTTFIHLFPAYLAFIWFLSGLLLSRDYLCNREPEQPESSVR